MVLICLFLCRSVSLHFPHPVFPLLPASLSLTLAPCLAPIFIPIRCLPLSFCLLNCPYPAFFPFRLHLHPPSFSTSRPHPLPVSQSLQASQSCLAPPALAYLASSFFPFLILFRLLNLARPSPSPSLWAILLCFRCIVRRKYSLFAPPPLIWLKRQFVLF